MSRKEKLLFSLILFFLTTLFLPWWPWLSVAAAAALVIGGLAFSPFRDKLRAVRLRPHLWGMWAFFGMIGLSVLLSENTDKGLRYLDPRLALFYFPIALGTLELRKAFRDQVLLGFAVLTTGMSAICLGWSTWRYTQLRRTDLFYNDALTEVLGQQSIYIALLVNLSVFIFGYHILYKDIKGKGWMGLAVLFLFAFSYLLASRIMMGVLYGVTLGFAFYYVFKQKKYLEGATLIMGLLIGVFIAYKFFPSTFNRFRELGQTSYNYQSTGPESHYNVALSEDQWNGANFRMAAWRCGWELFLEHPVIGVDIGDKKEELMKKYAEKDFQFAIRTDKNVHNNYLDVLYSLGAVGLLLLLAGWVVLPLARALRLRDGLATLFILTFAAAWVTEIYFDRSLGGMLTGFFIPFLLTHSGKGKKKEQGAIQENGTGRIAEAEY